MSIVHIRQDVVLMCYYLGKISSSLSWIRICVILITLRVVVEPWLKQHGW
jgi:hypothetical protein